jgi:hypothetical protein
VVSDPPLKQLITPTPPASAPAAAPRIDAAQVATGVVKAEPTPPAPPPRTRKQFSSINEAYDEEKLLWSKAIDAEANQDYVEAVRCYEEIKQLPREVQRPLGLEVRLELARRKMK